MPKVYPKIIKQGARNLRGKGWSLGEISLKMEIPKNTLSGWAKDIKLNNKQKERIKQKIIDSGKIGRPLAVATNRHRIEQWKKGVRDSVKHFENNCPEDPKLGKLICGILYLCEGAKYPSSRYLYLGNSDPKIISFFINALRKYYKIDENKLRFAISYR